MPYLKKTRERANDKDLMAPKPVRPRAIKYHGLFGLSTAAQHLMVDENWTPASLCEQYDVFRELLSHRVVYKRHEAIAYRRLLIRKFKELKLQCTDGHIKLQKIQTVNNAHTIRNFLINHRDMQRLYQRMPIYMVEDNINQRTFVLRKERDRLDHLLDQRKQEYRKLLVDRSNVENLIRYANEFVLEEEQQSRLLSKKIGNSYVRICAIRTINTTYKKMVQVLLQDEIFYEPILSSLDNDMEEQAQFIKNILYLGMPALSKFKQLTNEYRSLEEKSRKNLSDKVNMLNSLLKPRAIKIDQQLNKPKEYWPSADPQHYVRNTQSMVQLKEQLGTIESTIKELKVIACCSQAREIYPRIKSQVDSNQSLHRNVEKQLLNRSMLMTKMNCCTAYENILLNNLSEEEINRLGRISELKKILKNDERFERNTLNHIKNRADIFVMFRFSLWNIEDIMRHVHRGIKVYKPNYPNSYLKLPLLKFEMMQLRAIPPALYEENVDKIMHAIKRKLTVLMKSFKGEMLDQLNHNRNVYHETYLGSKIDIVIEQEDEKAIGEEFPAGKQTNIPNRKQIKAQSVRIVEANIKKEE